MEYYFFYGHKKENGYLSNWFMVDFEVDNKTFKNTEQYMMYQKAVLFNDTKMAEKILQEPDPRTVKKYGRKVNGFNSDIWQQNREKIMYDGNYAKYSQNEELKEKLLKTDGKMLVEASPYDKIWGIGLSEKKAKETEPDQWPGLNLLGKVLVKVRDDLKSL